VIIAPNNQKMNSQGASLKALFDLKLCDSLESSNGKELIIFNSDMILPYYIVKYEKISNQQINFNYANPNIHGIKSLDEEWKSIEDDAKADKFMNDCKKFYQTTLVKKDTEVKMGAIDSSQQWFNTHYAKKYEEEKKFGGSMTPTTPQSVDFELDYESENDISQIEEIIDREDDVDDEIVKED
jgi:hypothetical protein